MAKPIIVVRVPFAFMASENDIRRATQEQLNYEYNVLVVEQILEEVSFEVYNVDKQPEIDYEELKRLINGL